MKRILLALSLFLGSWLCASAQYLELPSSTTYSSGTTYTKGDVVSSGGATYVSIVANNTGNTPASSPSQWLALGSASSTFNGGTVTNAITAPGFTASGSTAGYFALTGGPSPSAASNQVVVAAPSAVATPYTFTFPSGPPSSINMQMQCSVTSGSVIGCNWAAGPTSGNLAGSTLAVAGFQVQAHSNSSYTDFSWNGNHADGTYQGCSAATNTVTDPNIYCNVPTGGKFLWEVNNSVIESIGPGIATRALTNGNYSDLSFNNKHDGTRIGFTAATSGDNNLYIDVPTGGMFMWRVAQGAVATLSASGFTPNTLLMPTATPASSSATCTAGQTEWDANYLYICTATNTWKRAALGTF